MGYAIGPTDSFGAAGLIGVRPGGCHVRSGSLGSFGWALVVVGFRRSRWVRWDAPWDSFGVAGFIGELPGRHRVRSGSQGSLECALGVFGFVRVAVFIGMHPGVLSGPLGLLGSAKAVVEFVRGHWVHWGAHLGSSVSCPGGRRVRSGSLGSLECALVVVVFVRCRWVHWDAHWGRRVRLGSLG